MELFQVFWDEGKKLFLEFKKDEKENQFLLPEKIKRLNLKFEISKHVKQDRFSNHHTHHAPDRRLRADRTRGAVRPARRSDPGAGARDR